MDLYDNKQYIEDLNYVAGFELPWEKLQDKSILISGATGLVGSFLVDVLMKKNDGGLNCTVYALSRNAEKATKRFSIWSKNSLFKFIPYDINKPLIRDDLEKMDYVLHMASNTHPIQYSTDPIGTITTNIMLINKSPKGFKIDVFSLKITPTIPPIIIDNSKIIDCL